MVMEMEEKGEKEAHDGMRRMRGGRNERGDKTTCMEHFKRTEILVIKRWSRRT